MVAQPGRERGTTRRKDRTQYEEWGLQGGGEPCGEPCAMFLDVP